MQKYILLAKKKSFYLFLSFFIVLFCNTAMGSGPEKRIEQNVIRGMIDGIELSIPIEYARLLQFAEPATSSTHDGSSKNYLPQIDSLGFEIEYPSLQVSTPLKRKQTPKSETVLYARIKSLNSIKKTITSKNYLIISRPNGEASTRRDIDARMPNCATSSWWAWAQYWLPRSEW